MSLKRYLLFVWEVHEANGGWYDYIKSFNSKKEAEEFFEDYYTKNNNYINDYTEHQIIDTKTFEDIP